MSMPLAPLERLNQHRKTHGIGSIKVVLDEYALVPNLKSPNRICKNCGKVVCSYKDPELKEVYCYACDHLTPWTMKYIVGRGVDRRDKRMMANLAGLGRGWHGPHILKKDRA